MTLLNSAFTGVMDRLSINHDNAQFCLYGLNGPALNHDTAWFCLYGFKGPAIYLVPPSGLLYDTVTIISEAGGGRGEGETSSWDSCFFDSIIFIYANFSENNTQKNKEEDSMTAAIFPIFTVKVTNLFATRCQWCRSAAVPPRRCTNPTLPCSAVHPLQDGAQ